MTIIRSRADNDFFYERTGQTGRLFPVRVYQYVYTLQQWSGQHDPVTKHPILTRTVLREGLFKKLIRKHRLKRGSTPMPMWGNTFTIRL